MDAGLLAAIIADKDDDIPRLLMADWLDEHGDRLRADFIRSQIYYPEIPTIGHIIENKWLGTIAKCRNPVVTFTRGFAEVLSVYNDDWVMHGSTILAEHPIKRIDIRRIDGGPVDHWNCRCSLTNSINVQVYN